MMPSHIENVLVEGRWYTSASLDSSVHPDVIETHLAVATRGLYVRTACGQAFMAGTPASSTRNRCATCAPKSPVQETLF